MRSCIYCGRELEKGEKCRCPQSERARAARASASSHANNSGAYGQNANTTYRTGYTKTQRKSFFKTKIRHTKKTRTRTPHAHTGAKEFFAQLRQYILSFIKDPVFAVGDRCSLNKWQILAIFGIQALLLSAVYSFAFRRLTSQLAKFMLLSGIAESGAGIYSIGRALLSTFGTAVFMCLALLLFSGIFFLIHRFMLRQPGNYWDFCGRLACATIPLTLLGIAGLLFGLFSVYSMIILTLCGIVLWLILTYEALAAQWRFLPKGQVLYIMLPGLLIFLTACMNILRMF